MKCTNVTQFSSQYFVLETIYPNIRYETIKLKVITSQTMVLTEWHHLVSVTTHASGTAIVMNINTSKY